LCGHGKSEISKLQFKSTTLNENDRRILIQETIDEAKESINHALNNIQHDQVPVFVVSAWKWYDYQNTGTIDDMEMAMEIGPLFEHLMLAYDSWSHRFLFPFFFLSFFFVMRYMCFTM
jgi:hypothetical protein